VERIEQLTAVGGFRLGGAARLDDCGVILADVFCRARRCAEILGADAPVHARHMVGAGQHVGERSEHCGFGFGRQ